ncbi:MAG TPA: glycoside hydrolase domain-containing protein [Actinomycetota bacterium]
MLARALSLVTALAAVAAVHSGGIARADAATPWRTLTYHGISFRVPADWPVVDLSADPTACVRFDVHAVYLGAQGTQPDCPAGIVGRSTAVQVQPAASGGVRRAWGASASVNGATYRLATNTAVDGELVATFPGAGVLATITQGPGATSANDILGSFAPADGGRASSPESGAAGTAAVSGAAGAGGTPVPRASEPTAATSSVLAPGIFDGLGFDACTAPSTDTMTSWLASPYRMVGVYVGGSNRACSQANLTSAWVSAVEPMGWRLIPTYVGLQAPCNDQGGMLTIDPSIPKTQGTNAANGAVADAQAIGLGAGTPIYFDMEAYDSSNASCSLAVERFLSAWTNQLHAQGYVSGVYGSAASTIAQLSSYYNDSTYARPDDIWNGDWNDDQSVFGDPYFPDTQWANHQRLHQYHGGHNETYGGVTINIDNDSADGVVAGEGRVIAFDSDRTGNRQIFLIGPDGVGATQITTNTSDNFAPALSPNGSQIAFTSTMDGNDDVWVMNVNGTNLRQLTHSSAFDGYPTWSPKGTKIAFQSDRAGNMDVYWFNADGSHIVQLTKKKATDERPSWSPSGQLIAFDSSRTGNLDVFTITPSGSNVTQLTHKTANDQAPDWSPDGSLIAFQSSRSGNADVYTMHADGSNVAQVTTDPAADTAPCWGPGGSQIGFTSTRTGSSQLFVADVNGSSENQYTFRGTLNEFCSWTD